MKPEAALHQAVARYLRVALRPPTLWTTIGHGGGGRVRGAQLKAMGLQPGWPDLLVIDPLQRQHMAAGAIFVGIELKAGKNKQSPEQEDMAEAFVLAGGFYRVCRSVEEVEGFLAGVGIPLFATTLRRAA